MPHFHCSVQAAREQILFNGRSGCFRSAAIPSMSTTDLAGYGVYLDALLDEIRDWAGRVEDERSLVSVTLANKETAV